MLKRIKSKLLVYLVICLLSISFFWMNSDIDAMGYSIIVLYILIPISILIVSYYLGMDKKVCKKRYYFIVLLGFTLMLIEYLTFSLANMLEFKHFVAPELGLMAFGCVVSGFGFLLGENINKLKKK